MIFALFFLQLISTAFGTSTNVHDIETVIRSYLSDTNDEHALHATSYGYMQVVQDESHLSTRYFQAARYILHGFPMYTNDTNDNSTVYKKLNFIQSIALYYCGMNISYIINTSFDNILINESELHLNSSIFPVQMVESYELIRSEICERIELGLYQSVVDMFKQDVRSRSRQSNNLILPMNLNVNARSSKSLSSFIRNVAYFISFKTSQRVPELSSICQMHQFLVKFGEFELHKGTVIHHVWQTDKLSSSLGGDIGICVNQIRYPKMHKYITDVLKQQVNLTGNQSFILSRNKTCDFWTYVQMYQLRTDNDPINHQAENNTVELRNLLQLLDECRQKHAATFDSSENIATCALIAFRIYESHKDRINGHEYVLNAIKCIIANHDIYCSKFRTVASATDYHYSNSTLLMISHNLRQSLSAAVFYPYIDKLMNDTQFVNIVNNNTDSATDTYLHTILSKLMVLALEEYKDIEMIKKIARVFKPKINVCVNCIRENKFHIGFAQPKMLSWMDMLVKCDCIYLTKYFQLRFKQQVDDCSSLCKTSN